jgi:hypothetical protein
LAFILLGHLRDLTGRTILVTGVSKEIGEGRCQRTQLLNGLRGHLTEIGVIAPQGPRHARELADLIETGDESIPIEVCEALSPLV